MFLAKLFLTVIFTFFASLTTAHAAVYEDFTQILSESERVMIEKSIKDHAMLQSMESLQFEWENAYPVYQTVELFDGHEKLTEFIINDHKNVSNHYWMLPITEKNNSVLLRLEYDNDTQSWTPVAVHSSDDIRYSNARQQVESLIQKEGVTPLAVTFVESSNPDLGVFSIVQTKERFLVAFPETFAYYTQVNDIEIFSGLSTDTFYSYPTARTKVMTALKGTPRSAGSPVRVTFLTYLPWIIVFGVFASCIGIGFYTSYKPIMF